MKTENLSCVPRVRFPGFHETWKVVRLGDIAELITEKVSSGTCIPMSVTSGKGLIPQSVKFGRIVAGGQLKNYTVIRKNDFAYNKSATSLYPEGFIALLEEYESGAVPSSIFTCFRIKTGAEPLFLKHLFMSNYHGKWFGKYIEVGARAHGSLSIDDVHIFNLPIPLPSIDEQQKIASCLSSIDDVIKETERKIMALKEHKKGMMQKLFPDKVDANSKIIFSNNNDAMEWTFYKIGDISTSFSGGTPKTSNSEYYGGQIPFIRSSEIHSEKTELFLTEEGMINSSAKIVSKGDILLALYGANSGDIAISKMNGAINQAILCIKVNCDKQYFVQYFTFIKRRVLSSMLQGGQGNLSAEIVKSIVIPLCPFPEQQKIASCLSSIDELITAYEEKLTLLRLHKKGLMQRLFPISIH